MIDSAIVRAHPCAAGAEKNSSQALSRFCTICKLFDLVTTYLYKENKMTDIFEKYPELSASSVSISSLSDEGYTEDFSRIYDPNWVDGNMNLWEIESIGPVERIEALAGNLNLLAIPASEIEEAEFLENSNDHEDTFPYSTPFPSLAVSIRLKKLFNPHEEHVVAFYIKSKLPNVGRENDKRDVYKWNVPSEEFNIACRVYSGVIGASVIGSTASDRIDEALPRIVPYPLKAKGGPWYEVEVWSVRMDDEEAMYTLSGDKSVFVEIN